MSACKRLRCQRDRRLIRREFSQWTNNLLLQIGLETLSKDHLDYDINLFADANDEQIPMDFNSNQTCLFCLNRKEYLSTVKTHPASTHLWIDNETDQIVHHHDNSSPIDQSSFNLNSQFPFDMKSDIPLIYPSEEYPFSHPWNYLFPTLPIDIHAFFQHNHTDQLAKQMAYLRMLEEIDHQRNYYKSQTRHISPMLTDSTHVNHILNTIMLRMINEIFEDQIKQQTSVSRQGELLFVKKQNNNKDNITIVNARKQHEHHVPAKTLSSSSSSSPSSVSSKLTNIEVKSKQNQLSPYGTSRRSRELVPNPKSVHNGDGKQIRSKRGRYQSEQLSKAVAVVLNNETSVRKAGSCFSVPHSTISATNSTEFKQKFSLQLSGDTK